jgi:two-component system cell cycle response regulator DivK
MNMAEILILIVEDNPKNLKLIRDILQFKEFATLEAETGEAGIALAREHLPALILMDIQLPEVDGCEAMRTLKADNRTQHIPIIALTALAMSGDRESLLAAGFDGYISKPIDVRQFPGVVKQYLTVVVTNQPRLIFDTELPLWSFPGPRPRSSPAFPTPLSPAESCTTASPKTRPAGAERGQDPCDRTPQPALPQTPSHRSRQPQQKKKPSNV